jgi:hypothetical protein
MRWLLLALPRLGTRTLAVLFAALFAIDLFLPDPLPIVDELLLGVTTLLLTRRRQKE